MKLLFDQNISFRIIKKIEGALPDSKHISELNLTDASDHVICEYARIHDYCIVTSDSDFIDISILWGGTPKIIWLRLGNTSTEKVAIKLISEKQRILDFMASPTMRFLQITSAI